MHTTKSLFHHLFIIGLNIALLTITLMILSHVEFVSAVLQKAQVEPIDVVDEVTEPVEDATELRSILSERAYYTLPFGAAEVVGYLTTIDRPTSLDDSTEDVSCAAFVVTEAPDLLMDALLNTPSVKTINGYPTAIVSEADYAPALSALEGSTMTNQVKVLAVTNSLFEGELIGCMSWPFSQIIGLE